MIANGDYPVKKHASYAKIDATLETIHLKIRSLLLILKKKKDLIFIGQLTTDMPYSIELFSNGCFVKDMRTGKIVATSSRKEWQYALDDWKMALFSTCFAKMTEDI